MRGLGHKRHTAAELLGRGMSRADVAQTLDVSTRTVDRWIADPNFQEMVNAAKTRLSESLQQKWDRLVEEHASAGQLLRDIALKRLEEIQKAQERGESLDYGELRALGESLSKAIAIEREALSMHFVDANRAIQEVLRLGFQVVRPDDQHVDVPAVEL